MPNENVNPDEAKQQCEIKTYKRRWLIVTLFTLIALVNSIPLIQYTIITNLVMKYYNVSAVAVYWTTIVSMASHIIMSVPSAYVIDRWGLRVAVLIGSVGTIAGLMTNLLASSRNSFWIIMTGQTILGIAAVPLGTLVPRLAAVWFGPDQLTTAVSVCHLGAGLGAGFGYLLPSMFISDHHNADDIGNDLKRFQWILVGAAAPIVVAILIYFPARPPLPSSQTQKEELHNKSKKTSIYFIISMKSLFTNKGFIILMLACCIFASVTSSFAIYLNPIVLNYFPNSVKDVGRIGFCTVIFGMIGSLFFGCILDRMKRYKGLTVGALLMATVSFVVLIFSMKYNSKVILYLASGIYGLLRGSYKPIAVQFAIELTYPCPEGTTHGVMLSITEIYSIIFIHVFTLLPQLLDLFESLLILVGFLIVAVIMTAFIPNDLRRQAVLKKHNEQIL